MKIKTERIVIDKKLPFDSDYVEKELKEKGYNTIRWAIVEVDDKNFIIDAAIYC